MEAAQERLSARRAQNKGEPLGPPRITNHHHHRTMSTDNEVPVGSDPQEDGENVTICADCGEDLPWHEHAADSSASPTDYQLHQFIYGN